MSCHVLVYSLLIPVRWFSYDAFLFVLLYGDAEVLVTQTSLNLNGLSMSCHVDLWCVHKKHEDRRLAELWINKLLIRQKKRKKKKKTGTGSAVR